MELNKSLTLEECICMLTYLLSLDSEYDWDSDSILYIMVKYDEALPVIKKLIDTEEELQKFIDTYREEDYIDIMALWGAVQTEYKIEIWVDMKLERFYIVRWYHRVKKYLYDTKVKIKICLRVMNHRVKFKIYSFKEDRRIKKRIKQLTKQWSIKNK